MDVRPSPFVLSLVASVALAAPSIVHAQEFRIETDVFVGDEEQAASHTVTLFEKSAVYEFVDQPEQVIVYRETGEHRLGQFILLDPATKRRTEIDVARVSKLMEKLTNWAAEQNDPLLKFSAKPQFKESFDKASGGLTLSNPQWTYRVATYAPDDREALNRYRAYTDRYAELTSMLYSSPPPGPRLALNAVLANHDVVPVEIRRTIGGDEKKSMRAEHLFTWRLARSDRARLDDVQKQLTSYEKVENEAFIAARTKPDAVRGQSK